MTKTGKAEIGKSRCTCGAPVTTIKGGVCTCGNPACGSVEPRTLLKQANDNKKT
jgi:hypothetical protein